MRPDSSAVVAVTLAIGLSTGIQACTDPDDGDPAPAGPDASAAAREAVLAVPMTEEWALTGLKGEVHVLRTESAVPHIYAASEGDLYRATGFVMARDRYLQFELGRRLGRGTLSALVGELALPFDQRSRGTGMTLVAEQLLERLTPEQGEMLDGFASGVNDYIDAVQAGHLPTPDVLQWVGPLLGLDEPASLMTHVDRRDMAGFATVAIYQAGFETTDLLRAEVEAGFPDLFRGAPEERRRRQGLSDDIWGPQRAIRPLASAEAGWGLETPGAGRAKPGRKGARAMLARLARRLDGIDRWLRGGREGPHGSNGWAVTSTASGDGRALVAGDGHLPLGVPSIFFRLGLDTRLLGNGAVHQLGLFTPGLPVMGVGTNGHVAWTQTYHRGDVTDWYREEIRLDSEGLPADSRFDGEWRSLSQRDETYDISAVLGGRARAETWPIWQTFDGRWVSAIEGRLLPEGEEAPDGAAVVTMLGDRVVPGDDDGDGLVSAISFDYAGFDLGDLIGALRGFGLSRTVGELREHTRRLVGYSQNYIVADRRGDILYNGYSAIPCRRALRAEDGTWLEGGDPRLLLDGTRFGGFEIPVSEAGVVDESAGDEDPSRCVVPFDAYPAAISPDRGFVVNANNDPAEITMDGSLENDPWYIGGPWSLGYRGTAIRGQLIEAIESGRATPTRMAEIQADHASPLGAEFAPVLIDAIEQAEAADEGPLVALLAADAKAFVEVRERLSAWIARGAEAASGVETTYHDLTPGEADDSVATMIFNAWFRAYNAGVFGDEGIERVWQPDPRGTHIRAIHKVSFSRGPGNPLTISSWSPETQESVFFDDVGTPEVESSWEIALKALAEALAALRAPASAPGEGGFGTDDMDAWRWGLRHMLVLDSLLEQFAGSNPMISLFTRRLSITPEHVPIAEDLPPGDPRHGLPGFPRPGDFFSIDVANPPFEGDSWAYSYGPVMRMVIALQDGRVEGRIIIPGGQSDSASSPHFADQVGPWLGNRTEPMRFHVADVVASATGHEIMRPR